ncbi:MAG: PAS domain S-box protein [Desulfobacterales bacterium]|nr:PAS domain S-box protein [Desulfobacterales bacterium]
MAREIAFYQQIVENMAEGVMVLDSTGKITLFNDAAAKILGLAEDTVMDRPFGQVFMMETEGNDEFTQTVLDAIYNDAVGLGSTVEFRRNDGEVRTIYMDTSYLKKADEAGDAGSGIVIVINDRTEIVQSRETEKKLNRQLTDAFMEMEETNQNLTAALKKVRLVRFIVVFAVILGIGGTGGWLWTQGSISASLFSETRPAEASLGLRRAEAGIRHLSKSVSLSGAVAPLEEINVTAPFDGKIKARYFSFDQEVKKGDPLILMDTRKLEVELRDAKAAFIKARRAYRDLEQWDRSTEVSNARRALTTAENSLDTLKRKQEESRTLYDKGIISRSELETSQTEYQRQQMDVTAARESLESALEKGNRENLDIAGMELENARIAMAEVEEKLTHALVKARVSGIAIKPLAGGSGGVTGESKLPEPGVSMAQGEILLTLGNLDGLSVKTRVDEIDIGKIKPRQKVRVSGDAFTGAPLEGVVRRISSNAESTDRDGPMFDVDVAILTLTPAQREMIRLGMSTNLEIMVYENPEAVVVPLACVDLREEKAFVKVPGPDGNPVEKEVTAGMTTLESVEILHGLAPGDPVFFMGGGRP